jgi:hypothetical protein
MNIRMSKMPAKKDISGFFIHSPLGNPALKGGDESVAVSTSNKPRTLVRGSGSLIIM